MCVGHLIDEECQSRETVDGSFTHFQKCLFCLDRHHDRQAHNLKVVGSNPTPATKISPADQAVTPQLSGIFVQYDSLQRGTK
jgi:hypothetical protein